MTVLFFGLFCTSNIAYKWQLVLSQSVCQTAKIVRDEILLCCLHLVDDIDNPNCSYKYD